ncbi:NAD(P)-dependent oxidoreductase [Streptomyces sp. NPDC057486]|uniref:NAD(P)-dependent oxidoreductase n=1 Tax=Streptomyces sp. NPDC057486 TaxID=3346145 RepID=UPI00367A2522
MGKVLVFGAGGRVGRAAVSEALRRGHHVTAVVRNASRHPDMEGAGVRLVSGDVTDADAVADLAAGHDAVIMAAYDAGAQPDVFFTAAARALLDGLARAGVGRLVAVGLAATLETSEGTPLMDTPGFPQEYRPVCLGHAAGTAVLRSSATSLDWLIISPAGDFDHAGVGSGRYSTSDVNMASRISHDDFAIALLDEIDAPRHHRTHVGVEGA